jgi:hypothetical protein
MTKAKEKAIEIIPHDSTQVEVMDSPVTLVESETKQVKEFYKGLLLVKEDDLVEGALTTALKGKEFAYRTDLQVIALAMKMRKEASGDAKKLDAASKKFKGHMEKITPQYKKYMKILFPTKSVFSQAEFEEVMAKVFTEKLTLTTAYAYLYENRPALPKGKGEKQVGTSSEKKESNVSEGDATQVVALDPQKAIVSWTVQKFGKTSTEEEGVYKALSTLRALVSGSITLEQVKKKLEG